MALTGERLRIGLVNMPFAALHYPSIALAQLKSVTLENLPGQVDVDIHHLNHDFASVLGEDTYVRISESVAMTAAGFGNWLFQPFAFPQAATDPVSYVTRYASALREERDLLDAHQSIRHSLEAGIEQAFGAHQLHRYDVVGFTSMFAQTAASIAMAGRIKQDNPDSIIVFGGANCETSMGSVLARNVEVVDYVFSGPSLRSFSEVVGRLVNDDREGCDAVTGVLSRAKLGRLGQPVCREIGEELDIDVDVPLAYADYLASVRERCPGTTPSLLFETSRGCWWGERSHCTFCGLNGMTMKYRAKRPDAALAQFESLFQYWPRVSHFKSVDNILPRSYLKEVLPCMEPPRGVSVFYEVKADLKGHEVEALSRAGITEIQPGIEALATSTLTLMGKGTSAFQNLAFLQNCLIHGVNPLWNLLVGFPGEPETIYQRYAQVLPALVHLPPPGGVFPVRFDRFSPYHARPEQFGLRLQPYDFYAMVYPFPDEDLAHFAYFFSDENHKNEYQLSTARWQPPLSEQVAQWRSRWASAAAPPQLVFEWRAGEQIVLDTRFHTPHEHRLEEIDRALLALLARAHRRERAIRALDEFPEEETELAFRRLRQRALLFEEDDKLMSLVINPLREHGTL